MMSPDKGFIHVDTDIGKDLPKAVLYKSFHTIEDKSCLDRIMINPLRLLKQMTSYLFSSSDD